MNKEIELLFKTIENKDKIINEQVIKIIDLQSKVNEAIEYIKGHYNNIGFYEEVDGNELLEILEGKK